MTLLGLRKDRASLHFGRFSLIFAASSSELQKAASLRHQLFLERRGLDLDETLEARRDESGFVLLLSEGSTPVATARVSPYPSPLSPLPAGLCQGLGADSEISRIACSLQGAGTRYSALLLTLGARLVLSHTDHRRYVAYALPKLSAAHCRLGAVDTGARCIVPQRNEPFHVLSGSYADTARCGSVLLGIDDLQRSA